MSGRTSVLGQDDDLEEDDDLELELGDEEEIDDQSDGEDSPETDDTEPPKKQKVAQDDYETRFKGLQGRLQQEVEQRTVLQNQLIQIQAQNALNNLIAQGKSPEEAQSIVQYGVAQYLLQQQGNQISTKEQALEQSARVLRAQQLAAKYHIPLDSKEYQRLERVKDPEDMDAFAEQVGTNRTRTQKTVAKEKRKQTGADNFGKGDTQTAPTRKKAKNLGDAADRFSKLKIEI